MSKLTDWLDKTCEECDRECRVAGSTKDLQTDPFKALTHTIAARVRWYLRAHDAEALTQKDAEIERLKLAMGNGNYLTDTQKLELNAEHIALLVGEVERLKAELAATKRAFAELVAINGRQAKALAEAERIDKSHGPTDNETTEAKLAKYDRDTYGDPYKPRDIG